MKKSINFFVGATLVLALLLVGQSELFAKAKPLPHTFDKDGAGIIVKGAQEVVVNKEQAKASKPTLPSKGKYIQEVAADQNWWSIFLPLLPDRMKAPVK